MDYNLEIQKLRFQSKVNKTDTCWLWTASRNRGGYGFFKADKMRLAHRVAWFHEHKSYPIGVLRHTCDNRICVNPAHLLDGTQQDNIDDMMVKGRKADFKGENNPSAKLTKEKVLLLREEYNKGGISTAEMARREQMAQSSMWSILNGKTYQ